MFFDLQFSEAKFLELLNDQVQRAAPLIQDSFDDPLESGTKLIIDHLDVTSVETDDVVPATITIATPGGTSDIQGNKTRIKINITAKLTTREIVINAGHLNIPQIKRSFPLWVTADISATAGSGQITLIIVPVAVGDLLNVLSAAQKQTLLAKMPSLNRQLPLPDVAGTAMNVFNAGITLHNGVIAILAEISAPNNASLQSWKNFFAGQFIARSGDWSIVLPSELIVSIVDKAITDAVGKLPADDPKVQIVSEPSTSWAGTGVASTATINAVDACPVFDSDIEADLNFFVTFSLDGDKIKVTIDVSWDLNDWDVFVCGLATVVLPGAVVTLIAGAIFGPIGAIIAAVATIVLFIVGLVKISDAAHGKLSDGVSGIDPGDMNLHTVTKDDEHAVIEGSVKLGQLMSGMTPTSVMAVPNGLMIAGTLDVPAHQERSLHIVGQSGFDWDAGYSCSSYSWQVNQLEASVGITEPASYPVLAQVEMLTQPANKYIATLTMYAPVTGFSVSVHSKVPANSGPDCEMLLWSNSGVRYANFGHLPAAPPPPTTDQLIKGKIGCMKFAPQGPQKWLEAQWLIDPPPYELVIDQIHIWDIVAGKLKPGTLVEVAVMGARGDLHEIAAIKAGANGQAAFRFTTTRGQSVAIAAAHGMDTMTLFRAGADLEMVARLAPLSPALGATVSGKGVDARVRITTAIDTTTFGLDGRALGTAAIKAGQIAQPIGNRFAIEDVSIAELAATGAENLSGAMHAMSLNRSPAGNVALRERQASEVMKKMQNRDAAVAERENDDTVPRLDEGRTARWYAEPWMKTPIRAGNLAARVHKGVVTVYRYRKTRMF